MSISIAQKNNKQTKKHVYECAFDLHLRETDNTNYPPVTENCHFEFKVGHRCDSSRSDELKTFATSIQNNAEF